MPIKNFLTLTVRPGSGTWFITLGSLTLTFILIMTSFCWGPIIDDYSHRRAFDSEIWEKSLSGDYSNEVRLWMINDLLRKHNLIGMFKSDIDELLGVPPKTPYFEKYDYVYRLGNERGFISVDSEWLVIKFENDRVTAAQLTRD